MCIVHKGFKGFRAVSPASILGGNYIGLKPAIPYDTIHSPLAFIPHIRTSRIDLKPNYLFIQFLLNSLANIKWIAKNETKMINLIKI